VGPGLPRGPARGGVSMASLGSTFDSCNPLFRYPRSGASAPFPLEPYRTCRRADHLDSEHPDGRVLW
jgi:hypothetical protein